MNPEPVAQGLLELISDVLVVGHNPNISILASLLLSAERGRTRAAFNTCNMACLTVNPIDNFGEVGPCELSWMLDPRML
jgi:phosphohistidine phosphatase SixA